MAHLPKRPLAVVAWTLGLLVMIGPTVIALRLTSKSYGQRAGLSPAESPSPSPSASTSPSATSSPAVSSTPTASLRSVQLDAPVVSWNQAFHGVVHDIPNRLRDGRWFDPATVISADAVVGTVQSSQVADSRAGSFGVVVINPATADVTDTITLGTNAAADERASRDQTDVVSANAANSDWVVWLRGHQGDDDGFARATIYAQNLHTRERLVLGTAQTGDSSQLTPTISGQVVSWADPAAIHVYSLSQRRIVYALPTADNGTATFVDGLRWPWLSFEVRETDTTESPTPIVFHLVDLRVGSDRIVTGPCDGSWCETTSGAGSGDTLGLVSQTLANGSRLIASKLGGFGGFDSLAGGLALWGDTDPYAPGYGTDPDVVEPAASSSHSYLYDPAGNRSIELPALQNDVVFMSGEYVVWQDRPADPSADGTLHFADLAGLSPQS